MIKKALNMINQTSKTSEPLCYKKPQLTVITMGSVVNSTATDFPFEDTFGMAYVS